ncbi:unnamed protein product [Sphenostylis stenocarpa]|uniref:Uncharacterized protein n=1 Tax=Sphenostylis stenocarpa TaxID=92480 RepID=A0AA86SSQ9_9FABA|nr:unnamed protein product [Sphenostylis stenocarpa]
MTHQHLHTFQLNVPNSDSLKQKPQEISGVHVTNFVGAAGASECVVWECYVGASWLSFVEGRVVVMLAEVAFGVLVRRVLDLMKKLRVTEVRYHRDLFFAIVESKASFGLSYLKEFPYNIENFKSSSWIPAISVAAQAGFVGW